jgi:membrane protein DedA with SNARE-associated domain
VAFKDRLQTAKYPLVIAALLLGFTLVYWLLGLPTSDELAKIVGNLLAQYGYTIVFVAALIETIPFFDVYFPGSTIVVLAVTLSQQGKLNVFIVLAIAGLTFIFGYLCDYVLGRYGIHRIFIKY